MSVRGQCSAGGLVSELATVLSKDRESQKGLPAAWKKQTPNRRLGPSSPRGTGRGCFGAFLKTGAANAAHAGNGAGARRDAVVCGAEAPGKEMQRESAVRLRDGHRPRRRNEAPWDRWEEGHEPPWCPAAGRLRADGVSCRQARAAAVWAAWKLGGQGAEDTVNGGLPDGTEGTPGAAMCPVFRRTDGARRARRTKTLGQHGEPQSQTMTHVPLDFCSVRTLAMTATYCLGHPAWESPGPARHRVRPGRDVGPAPTPRGRPVCKRGR